MNLASRLMRHVEPTLHAPCISRETYDLVGNRFLYKPDNPRLVELKGLGRRKAWDVLGRNPEISSSNASPGG